MRGQFIKHGDGDGGGAGGGLEGAGGSGLMLVDDGAATASNGAKSGTGGAGGVGGLEDAGAEDEVQTNSRGYYEVRIRSRV